MILEVEHLGPLERARVDLSRDFIVLAGPNNTGKTYLAWTVYGLCRNRFIIDVLRPSRSTGFPKILSSLVDSLLDEPVDEVDMAAFLDKHGAVLGAALGRAHQERLPHDFACDASRFAKTQINLTLTAADLIRTESLPVSQVSWSFPGVDPAWLGQVWWHGTTLRVFATPRARDGELGPLVPLTSLSEAQRRDLRNAWVFSLIFSVEHAIFPHAVLFPAERIATNLFAKELSLERTQLVDELLEQPIAGENLGTFLQQRAGRYPLAIRDSLRVANDLENLSRQTSPFADLADELEASIVGGRVKLSQHGQLAFAPAASPGVELSVHLSASVVKSLSSLVFHLRHRAREGQLLIIDEPELNLHPDNQRAIVRILAKMVNRGLKVMISTHSDYVIRELNNLVMLSQDSERMARARTELGYSEDQVLAPDKLGVYFFDGRTNHDVPVNHEGFEIRTIEHAIDELNRVSQAIYAARLDDE